MSCKKEKNSPTHCNADSRTAGLLRHCFPGGLFSYSGETVAYLSLPLHDHSWKHLLNILLLQATSLICVLAGRYFSPSFFFFFELSELQKCKWPEKPNEISICPKPKERPRLLLQTKAFGKAAAADCFSFTLDQCWLMSFQCTSFSNRKTTVRTETCLLQMYVRY